MGLSATVLSFLASLSMRSLLLAGVTLLFVLVFRVRGAAARHAITASVLAGMLAL